MKIIIIIATALFLISCSSTDEKVDTSTAEGAFKLAQKYEKDERYEEALSYFAEIKNKHPYSKWATESELRIADIHFKRESYLEAETAYKIFKEFHPKYEKIDYVTYRLGLSFYNQLPDTIDRDLTLASSAILYFDEVISSFPNSKYVKKAKKHKAKSYKMLAEKEMYVANFYFARKKYDSALGRFEDLLKKYPNLGLNAKALYGATVSAYKVKQKGKAQKYLSALAKTFPKSKEYRNAKKEVKNGL